MKKNIVLFFAVSIIGIQLLMAQQTDSLSPRVYNWDGLTAKKEENRIIRQVLEGSTTSLSHFEVQSTTLEPGKAPHPPHVHEDMEELIIVKDGQVKITIEGTSKIMGPGSIAFAMPGDEHGIENISNTQATYYILKYKSKRPMNLERAKQNGGSFMLDWNELKTSNTGKGYRRNFFNRATSQLNQFEMHTTALHADSVSHAPHTHVQEEIVLILRGNIEMYIDGKHYKGSAGDLYFLSSNVPHALKNTGKEQCEYFAFQWRN